MTDKPSVEVSRRFEVNSIEDGHAWLRLLEGSKSGLDFAVKATDEQLSEMEEGEKITTSVRSLNEERTAWEIVEVNHE